jgi:glycosyltransferase involved in cell wall biosynthesis
MDNVLRTTASGQVLDRMPMTDRGSKGSRLGVYVDDVYHLETANRERLSTDRAFLLFVCEVGRRFDRLVLFGRTLRSDRSADYVLPSGIGLAELPHYSNLADVREVLRSAMGTVRGMWRGLWRVDTVWIFGPHPFALLLIALATLRRRRIVLGVRQDTVAYHRARLPSGRWSPLLIPVLVMDRAYRTLSRFFPATAVGPEVARRYGLPRSSLLTMTASLVRASDIGMPAKRDWSGRVRLLTVGRLKPEKNPALLVRALARLERDHPGSFELMWLGRGRLEAQVRRLADELHVADRLEVRGYIPLRPRLARAVPERPPVRARVAHRGRAPGSHRSAGGRNADRRDRRRRGSQRARQRERRPTRATRGSRRARGRRPVPAERRGAQAEVDRPRTRARA